MLRFTEVGFTVLGFDIDDEKVRKLNNESLKPSPGKVSQGFFS